MRSAEDGLLDRIANLMRLAGTSHVAGFYLTGREYSHNCLLHILSGLLFPKMLQHQTNSLDGCNGIDYGPVSYTHLTLPTILLV